MKKTLLSIALSSVLASTAFVSTQAAAVEGLSANVGGTTNYLWRGLEQNGKNPALSAGIDYANESGLYVGTWVSNVDFEGTEYELDFYGGFSGDLGNGFGYDVGYIYYAYDSSADSDFSEVYASISYDAYSITYNTLVDSDWGDDFGDATYISADAEFELNKDVSLGLHIGNYDFDAGGDYVDYNATFNHTSGFSLALSQTDLSGDEGDVKFSFSYSTSFDL